MVEYNGMLFAAIGVPNGKFPIARSLDGGGSFSPVPLMKNGRIVRTTEGEVVRTLDLIVHKNILYAIYYNETEDITYDLYRYENGVFYFEKGLLGTIYRKRMSSHNIKSKIEFRGQMYLATGYFYVTSDMENFERIELENSEIVCDLYLEDNTLYVLCYEELEDGGYKTSVLRNDKRKKDKFSEVFSFVYDVPPLSLVVDGDDFYIGMGSMLNIHDKNGMILKIER